MRQIRQAFLIVRMAMFSGVVVAISGGCSGTKSEPANSKSGTSKSPAVEAASKQKTADVAVREVLDGLRRREARAIWNFLPPSYRQKMQQAVRDFGTHCEDDSWRPFVTTWQRARKILPTKIAVLASAASSKVEGSPNTAGSVNPSGVVRLLNAIGDSEISSVARIRDIDLAKFFDKTGQEVLTALGEWSSRGSESSDPFEILSQVEVTLVSATGDSAVVRVRWPGQPATEHVFVLVEGHWLPKSIADDWSNGVQSVRNQAIAWADEVRSKPEVWQSQLKTLNRVLDELENAQSVDEIKLAWTCGVRDLQLLLIVDLEPAVPENAGSTEKSTSTKPARIKKPDTEELLPDVK